MKTAGALLLVAAAVGAGAWVHRTSARLAATTTRVDAERVPVGQASPPTPGDLAADFASPPAAPKIPERLPPFSLNDRDGHVTSIAQWDGKSLVLNFWATWCAPCRREIPLLKALSSQWRDRNVEVIGVAVDRRDKVVAYADELKIPYPILIGEQDALDLVVKFGLDSPVFPFTVFTDRRGRVITLYLGELHQPVADLILGVVEDINEDRVDLAAGRHRIMLGLDALKASKPG